jgi:hypothetical protein
MPRVFIQAKRLSNAIEHVREILESLVLKVGFEEPAESRDFRSMKEAENAMYMCILVGRVRGLDRTPRLKKLEFSWALLSGWWKSVCFDRWSRERMRVVSVSDHGL